MKLLLIEDDAVDEKAFLRAARKIDKPVEVSCFASLEAYLHELDDLGIPDLIVTDLKLPGARGVELPVHLRGRGAVETVPLIMLSTSAEVEDIRSSYANGFAGYFCKPGTSADWSDLLTTILSYWEKAESTKTHWEKQ